MNRKEILVKIKNISGIEKNTKRIVKKYEKNKNGTNKINFQ